MNLKDFDRLAQPHLESVFRVARRFAVNDDGAGDLVQETYLRARRMIKRFDPSCVGVCPWLLSILHTAINDRPAPASLTTIVDDEPYAVAVDCDGPAPTNQVEDNPPYSWSVSDERLAQAIKQLRPEYRGLLLLWGVEGMSCHEIARVLGYPTETVERRLSEARSFITARLTLYDDDPAPTPMPSSARWCC